MTRIKLTDIVFDAGTQIREAINDQVVSEYAERMADGVEFPAVVLFHDGNRYYLADGFHRYMASQRNAFVDIVADVRPGTKEDALWFALGANKANGHRMTDADKRHAIALAVSVFPDRSMRQIADQVGCSSTYASRIRAELQISLQPVERVIGADGTSYPASRSAAARARAEAERLTREGSSVAEVQRATGIGRDAAQRIRKEVGVGVDKSRDGVRERRERMRVMAEGGYTSRQIAAELGISEEGCRATLRKEGIDVPGDAATRNAHRHDSTRIIEHIVMDAENLTADVNLIDFSALDSAQIATWLESLKASRDKLGAFIRRLMQEQQNGKAA